MFEGFGQPRVRGATLVLSAISLVGAGLAWSGSAGASVGSDQTNIAKLEQQIAEQGQHAQSLVGRYNEVQSRLSSLNAQIAHDGALLAADRRVEAAAVSAVTSVAVTAYVSGAGTSSPALAMFSGRWSASRMLEQNQYLGAANNTLEDKLTALHLDQVRTRDAQRGLRSEQTQAKKTLDQLTTAHDAATAAIAADDAELSHVKGDLRSLLAEAQARRRAAEAAEERDLAAAPSPVAEPPVTSPAPSSALPPSTPAPPSSSTSPSSGTYANPFRDAGALSPERIDQGVDYAGFGPIYAIGDGVVLTTVGSGWPGGTFIAYRLTDGPANGLVVYLAEDVEASVQVGTTVTASTVIGHMFAGPDGIETGWADGSAMPDTMARAYGQFNGSNSSAFGYNFSQLLQSLGAPGGIMNAPVHGALPAGWPSW